MSAGSRQLHTAIATAVIATLFAACAKDNGDSSLWTDPVVVAGNSEPFQPAIAISTSGQRVAIWAQRVESSQAPTEERVVIGTKPAVGSTPAEDIIEIRKVTRELTRFDLYAAHSVDDKGWSEPTLIQTGGDVHTRTNKRDPSGKLVSTENASFSVDTAPSLITASNGDVLAAWTQTNGSLTSVYAARFTAATASWSAASEIDGSTTLNASSPQSGFAGGNTPIVVFVRAASNGSGAHQILSTQLNNSAWSTPAVASSATCGLSALKMCNARHPKLAANANGAVFAVWEQETTVLTSPTLPALPVINSALTNIYTARYEAGAWINTQKLSDGNGDAKRPAVTINASGKAWAAWEQDDDSLVTGDRITRDPQSIWAIPFTGASGTIATVAASKVKSSELVDLTYMTYSSVDLALDDAGTVTLVWQGQRVYQGPSSDRASAWNNADTTRIWAARRAATETAWSTPVTINAFTTFDLNKSPLLGPNQKREMSAIAPRIALAANGQVAAIWNQISIGRKGDAGLRAYASVADALGVWSTAERVSSDLENSDDVTLAGDAQGHVAAVWVTDGKVRSAELKR